MLRLVLLALALAPRTASAGGVFDSGWGMWNPAGLWHRTGAGACVSPHSGADCAYYGIDAGCTYNNGLAQDASLTSLGVTITPAADVLSFWMLYQVQSWDPECQDQLRLEYSLDASAWYLVQDLSTGSDPAGGSPSEGFASGGGVGGVPLWEHVTVNLGAYVGRFLYLRFRFVSSDSLAGDGLCGPPDGLEQYLGYALDEVSLGPPPPLALSKSAAPALGPPGQTFTYTLSAENTGAAAADVSVWDSLPSGADFVSASGAGSEAGGLASWTLPGLSVGQTQTLTLVVRADPALAEPAEWVNTAAGSSSLGGGAVLSSPALIRIRASGLSLAKSVLGARPSNGDADTYVLVVENDTALTQTGLTLSDPLPAAFSLNQAFPQPGAGSVWSLPSLPPGGVFSATLWGSVYGQDGQVVVNTASLEQGQAQLAQASASLTVHRPVQPAIALNAIYPNPAPSRRAGLPQDAFVAYSLNTPMPVTLDIFTVAGEKVRSLAAPGAAGVQQVAWDLANEHGQPVASGVYLLVLWSTLQVQPRPQATGYVAVLR